MKRHILPKAIILLAIVLSACCHEDTATVTIYTGLSQARMGIIDRVLALISLSTPAKALPGPSDVTSMTVTVSAPDMLPLTIPIPVATGSVTFEVPAGNARTFTVVAIANIGVGAPNYIRKYGGITVANLSPGENKDLLIEMGELFLIAYFNYTDYQFYIETYKDYKPVAFNIYQNLDGIWYLYATLDVATYFNVTSDPPSYYNYSSIINYILPNGGYGITGVNKYGEGEIYEFIW